MDHPPRAFTEEGQRGSRQIRFGLIPYTPAFLPSFGEFSPMTGIVLMVVSVSEGATGTGLKA